MAPLDHVTTVTPQGRVECACGEVSPRMGTEALKRQWAAEHRREALAAEPVPVRCTASGQQRTWTSEAWSADMAYCPDCGAETKPWVRGADLFPHAKVRAHKAPPGVTPAPYAVHPDGGLAVTPAPFPPVTPEVLDRALTQSARGETRDLGDFTQYAPTASDGPQPYPGADFIVLAGSDAYDRMPDGTTRTQHTVYEYAVHTPEEGAQYAERLAESLDITQEEAAQRLAAAARHLGRVPTIARQQVTRTIERGPWEPVEEEC